MTKQNFSITELRRKLEDGSHRAHNLSPDVAPDTVVLKGAFQYARLREGLSLHTSHVTETHDMAFSSQPQPGMSFLVFSKGNADVDYGDRRFHFGAPTRPGQPLDAVVVNRKYSEGFVRHTRRGTHVRKMVISVSSQWLESDGHDALGGTAGLKPFMSEHLATCHFPLPARLGKLVEDVMAPPVLPPALHRLFLESRAIEIVAGMLAGVVQCHDSLSELALKPIEQRRLSMAIDFIDAHLPETPGIDAIAHEVGISASSLQRLFHAGLGCSVFEYVRKRRMEQAMQALRGGDMTIAQAAYIAGYCSPSNFATAFRRIFGVTPSEARGG